MSDRREGGNVARGQRDQHVRHGRSHVAQVLYRNDGLREIRLARVREQEEAAVVQAAEHARYGARHSFAEYLNGDDGGDADDEAEDR